MTPTHKCRECGALWKKHDFPEESWQCVTPNPGKCCDNAIMGKQIESLTPRTDARMQPYDKPVYGHFTGGDPRDFHPDGECCTEAEMDNHRKACALWNEMEAKGETPTPEACPSGWNEERTVHVLRAPYGIGVQNYKTIPTQVSAEFALGIERELSQARTIAHGLAGALGHMQTCVRCAEDNWEECEGGRAALAALRAYAALGLGEGKLTTTYTPTMDS